MEEKKSGVAGQPAAPDEKSPISPCEDPGASAASESSEPSAAETASAQTAAPETTSAEAAPQEVPAAPAAPSTPSAPEAPAAPSAPPAPEAPAQFEPPVPPQQPVGQQPPQSPAGQPAQPFVQQPPQPMGYGSQGSYPPPPAPPTYVRKGGGKAVGALVCGILAILLSFTPLMGIILGIVAIVLASKAVKEAGRDGKATAGKVCGIVGIVLAVLSVVFWGIASFAYIALNDLDANRGSYNSTFGEQSGSYSSEDLLSSDEEAVQAAAAAELDKLVAQDEGTIQLLAAQLDEGFIEGMGMSHADLGVDPADLARWMLADFSYVPDGTYVDSYGNTKTATMFVDIKLRDSYKFMTNFYNKVSEFEQSEEVKTMSQYEAALRIGELYKATMDEMTDMTSWYASIELENQGGQWVVDQDDWNGELDAMFGIY